MQLDPCLDASSMFDPCQELGRSNPKFHKPNFSNVQETPNKTSSFVWSLTTNANSLRGEHLASNPTDLAALSGLVKPPRLAWSNFTTDESPCFGCLLLLSCDKCIRFPWISLNGTMKPPRNQSNPIGGSWLLTCAQMTSNKLRCHAWEAAVTFPAEVQARVASTFSAFISWSKIAGVFSFLFSHCSHCHLLHLFTPSSPSTHTPGLSVED